MSKKCRQDDHSEPAGDQPVVDLPTQAVSELQLVLVVPHSQAEPPKDFCERSYDLRLVFGGVRDEDVVLGFSSQLLLDVLDGSANGRKVAQAPCRWE